MKKKADFPIIRIIGLPGVGKSTFGKSLSRKIGVPVFKIDDFRKGKPQTAEGEADAWLALFRALSKHKSAQEIFDFSLFSVLPVIWFSV